LSESGDRPRRKPGGLPRWVTQLLAVLVLIFLVHLWQTRDVARGSAPELSGRLLDGKPFDLSALRGQRVLVHFWATWCPVCKMQHGTIESLAQDHTVVTVAMQSGTADQVTEWMAEEGVTFPVLVDKLGVLAGRWGVSGVPTSFVVDGSGRIAFAEVGYTTGPGLRARLAFAGD
jgi:peroxiredoxin